MNLIFAKGTMEQENQFSKILKFLKSPKLPKSPKLVNLKIFFQLPVWEKIYANFVSKIGDSGNLSKRVYAALVMLPIAIFAILFSQKLFEFLSILITIIMTAEWLEMTKNQENQKKWQIFGLFFIAIPIYCVMQIRHFDGQILLWMFSIIWVTDIFAFFVGRKFGGAKLMPEISPNKTWSGLIGGVIASAMLGLVSKIMFPSGSVFFFFVVSIALSVLEQISDLFESKIKRICGVKDSGSIIPGHGGLLDRLDGMILLSPVVWILINLFPKQFS